MATAGKSYAGQVPQPQAAIRTVPANTTDFAKNVIVTSRNAAQQTVDLYVQKAGVGAFYLYLHAVLAQNEQAVGVELVLEPNDQLEGVTTTNNGCDFIINCGEVT